MAYDQPSRGTLKQATLGAILNLFPRIFHLLIDTHCHLNLPPLGGEPDAVIARARARSVGSIIVPAYDQEAWADVLTLASRPNIHAALGLHPWVADQASAEGNLKEVLAEAIAQAETKVVAIGEIGLDTKVDGPPLDTQISVLKIQVELAADLDLPVILHCRGAFSELLGAIKHYQGNIRGVIHAFSRGPELAQRFHAAGLHFGLGGGVTRENARKIRRGAKVIPLNRLVLETDAPSIGVAGVRPENTEPHHVADVATALADLRDEDLSVITEATTANATRLFGLPEK